MGERFSGLVRKKSTSEAELVVQMSPARGGWEDFLVWVPAADPLTGAPQPSSVSCCRGVSGQEDESTFIEGLLSVRPLLIQGRGNLPALPSVTRFCQEMLGLDCLLPLGGRK